MRNTFATTLLAQRFAAGRQLLESCDTANVATCFKNVVNGGDIDLVPGTMSSWDQIDSHQLTLNNKYASIACSADGGVCVWQGATEKGVVRMQDNGGTTTLSRLMIKDGNAFYGGGLYLYNSNVVLILIDFIDNAAYYGGAISVINAGSSTATLQGCSFAGNTAGEYGPDVFINGQTMLISECPAGEDKPTLPPLHLSPPSLIPPLFPSPPSSLPPSPLLSSQVMLKSKVPP